MNTVYIAQFAPSAPGDEKCPFKVRWSADGVPLAYQVTSIEPGDSVIMKASMDFELERNIWEESKKGYCKMGPENYMICYVTAAPKPEEVKGVSCLKPSGSLDPGDDIKVTTGALTLGPPPPCG